MKDGLDFLAALLAAAALLAGAFAFGWCSWRILVFFCTVAT